MHTALLYPRISSVVRDLTGVCDQHPDGITSKWTSLSPGNVPLLENVWLPWQLPSQWHSWSPTLTAIIPSQSSTPRLPGSGLVSIFSRRSPGTSQEGGGGGTAVLRCGILHSILLTIFLAPDKTPKGKKFLFWPVGLRNTVLQGREGRRKKHEAASHVVFTVRKRRDVDSSCILSSVAFPDRVSL